MLLRSEIIMFEELIDNLSSFPYFMSRFKLAINSWFYYMSIQPSTEETFNSAYGRYPRNNAWSYYNAALQKDGPVAVNFWSIINEGWLDMIEETSY